MSLKTAGPDYESEMERTSDHSEDAMDMWEQIRTATSFCGVAIVLHSFFTLILAGSEDILAGTSLPTTTILISHVAPMSVVATVFPWFMQRYSYLARILAVFVLMTIGLLMLTFMDSVYLRIVAVSVNAVAHAVGEVSFLALSVFYGRTALTAFAAGTGAGILIGPLFYTGMTSWSCVSPQRTLLTILPAPLIVLACYSCLDKDRIKPYAFLGEPGKGGYALLDAAGLSWREKLTAALQVTPLVLTLLVTYVAQYVTVQAVVTTLAFTNAPFAPRDHFVYYALMNGIGEFLTRSYLNVVLFIKPSAVPSLIITRTWALAIPLLGIMGFVICASYFRFLSDVFIVMATCLAIGSLSGTVFANTVCAVPMIVEPRYQEFCLGLVAIGEFAGALLASLAGLEVEPALREHCRSHFPLDTCFTRNIRTKWLDALCS